MEALNPFNDFVFLDATPSVRGSFTLATEKALEKLEKFQLPDPSFFILQWVQALAANRAERIDILYSANTFRTEFEMTIRFTGPGYSREEIDDLYDHVFRSGRDRSLDRLRELALGWLSAGALGGTSLLLESGGRRRLKEGGQERTENCQLSPFHSLVVKGRGSYPFEQIVTRRCGECISPIFWNGKQINSAAGAGVQWPNRPFEFGPTKGLMGATYGSVASHLAILRYGVEFVSRPEHSLLPPVALRVSDPTLSKNVSQTDVVQDEAYEEFLGRLRIEMKTMGLQLTRMRIPSYQRDALNRFLQAYLAAHIDVRVFDDPRRLKLMGEEYGNLVRFPLFNTAGRYYLSLEDLRKEYAERGYLLYSLDERSKLTRWEGTLLVLQPEEVVVLKKFFSNLMPLDWEDVRTLAKYGDHIKLTEAQQRPVACEVVFPLSSSSESDAEKVRIQVPDLYPTGQAVLVREGELFGQAVPRIALTLILKLNRSTPLSNSETAHLKANLVQAVRATADLLVEKLSSPHIAMDQSRLRYAELLCEELLFLHSRTAKPQGVRELLQELGPEVAHCPMIGLENGELVSPADILVFLQFAPCVYLGGAFVDGLESGALDPMPCARRLIEALVPPSHLLYTHTLRHELKGNSELAYAYRRQTILKGLALHPAPDAAFRNFAGEAAAHEQEMARLELEYKRAIEQKLFVQPDQTRLEKLAETLELIESRPERTPYQASDEGLESSERPAGLKSVNPVPPHLPSVEADLNELRRQFGDFCSSPGATRLERYTESYSLCLCNRWIGTGLGEVVLLREGESNSTVDHALPFDGFVRTAVDFLGDPLHLLQDAMEQLVLRMIADFRGDSAHGRHRQRLQEWLLECCRLLPAWQQASPTIFQELTTQPLVPCLGGRLMSFRQLLEQAKRLELTPVRDPARRAVGYDPSCLVMDFEAAWRDEVLAALGFPSPSAWHPQDEERNFDTLLYSSVREIINVLRNNHADLLDPNVVGKLESDASFWRRWKSGFLSWDAESETVRVNTSHKLAKALLGKFAPDPTWSVVFSCALFSTINRGLDEVEDRHEKEFLSALLDTLQ